MNDVPSGNARYRLRRDSMRCHCVCNALAVDFLAALSVMLVVCIVVDIVDAAGVAGEL